MLIKETRKLFKDTYQYKAVLVSPGSTFFRGGDLTASLALLSELVETAQLLRTKIKTHENLQYCLDVAKTLLLSNDYEIRVEYPLLTVYSNSKSTIDALVAIDESCVKYISVPPAGGNLVEGVVIMPKIDFEFKVTLGSSKQDNSTFVTWADNNSKVKLTNSARRDLGKNVSWGGAHFYVTGDNNLLMSRMMLGGCINKVEKIVKK